MVTPYKHQLDALERSRTTNELALFFDMGTGKTFTSIMILQDKIKMLGRLPRTLVIGPLSVVYNWQNEFVKYTNISRKDVIVPSGSGAKKADMITKEVSQDNVPILSKIVVINYEALLNPAIFRILTAWSPEFIIFDESHLLKNHQAKRSKLSAKLSDEAEYKLILTGTPIANSPIDAFMQYRILDGGKTFGRNITVFKSLYFEDENAGMPQHRYYPSLVPRTDKFEELSKKIFSKALRVKKEDCLDLPPRIEQKVYVEMSEKQKKAYAEMKRDFIAFVEDSKGSHENKAIVAQMAMTKAMKMQQIVTGFALAEDGSVVDFGKIPRLIEVEDLLEQLTPNYKVIIWTCFKYNIVQLGALCDKLDIKWVKIDGSMNGKEKQEAINDFESTDASSARVVIANRRAGGTGINLVQAAYSIVYSKNQSLIEDSQSRDRNYRGGSQIHKQIVKLDLCCKGTVDELIDLSIEDKVNLAETILTIKKGDI